MRYFKTLILLIFSIYSMNAVSSGQEVTEENMPPNILDIPHETRGPIGFDEISPMTLNASSEGLYCNDFLKAGGVRGKNTNKSIASTSAMWGATIGGSIATAPTVVGPVIILIYGGIASTVGTVATVDTIMQSKQNKKLGKKIEDSYMQLGLIEAMSEEQSNKSQKRFDAFYGKFTKYYPTTSLSKNEFAEGIVRANEAGWFCSMRTYEKDLNGTQLYERHLAYQKLKFKPQFGKAKSDERRSLGIFKIIFPNGVSVAPSENEIYAFRSRNQFIIVREKNRRKAAEVRQMKNNECHDYLVADN